MTTYEQPQEHPVPDWCRPVTVSRLADRSTNTPQTLGMQRFAAISRALTGSRHLWMGGNTMQPGQRSGDHHHREADSGIYIVSGHPRFVFLREGRRRARRHRPG
jgi:uncharacterized RmlC-like cupin family protein